MNKKFNSKPFLFNSPLLIKKKMTLLTSNFQTVEYFNKKKENEETHWSLKASIITVNASSGTSPIRLLPYTHTHRGERRSNLTPHSTNSCPVLLHTMS